MLALQANSISKRFPVRTPGSFRSRHYVEALRDVSISVAEGEVLGIVGESGSGKSTLARVMIGATSPDTGDILLYGSPFRHGHRGDRQRMTASVQMVLQDSTSTLNPRLSLTDAVSFGPWARGADRRRARRIAEGALDRVGLPPLQFGNRRPSEISGGQRQRANLARAIVLDPKILFLDEPVSALDKTVQAQILNLLAELRKDLGLTMVLISHDLDVIRYVCSRTAVMRSGEIVEARPTEELFANPRHDYTRSLIAALPEVEPPRNPHPAPPTAIRTGTPLLDVGDLHVSLTRGATSTRAVRGVSFALQPGNVLAVVGESGSGKSVMLRALLGLLPPAAHVSGRIAFGDRTVEAGEADQLAGFRGRTAGLVFQDPLGSLDPMASIGRQLEDVLMAQRRLPRGDARTTALSLLDRVHLTGAAERYAAMPHELSGGQRQRVGIALALAGDPVALLADEPTTALDVSVQARILELLRRLVTESGIGLVMVTHDMAVAREMADRIAVMYAGRIVEEGPAGATLDAPRHPYTRALLDSYLGVRRRQTPLPSLGGAPPRLAAEPSGCAFADRCPLVVDQCHIVRPPSVVVGSRRWECLRTAPEGDG